LSHVFLQNINAFLGRREDVGLLITAAHNFNRLFNYQSVSADTLPNHKYRHQQRAGPQGQQSRSGSCRGLHAEKIDKHVLLPGVLVCENSHHFIPFEPPDNRKGRRAPTDYLQPRGLPDFADNFFQMRIIKRSCDRGDWVSRESAGRSHEFPVAEMGTDQYNPLAGMKTVIQALPHLGRNEFAGFLATGTRYPKKFDGRLPEVTKNFLYYSIDFLPGFFVVERQP
jgi:hypothetical protein